MPVPWKIEIQKLKSQKKVLQQELLMFHLIMEGMRKNLKFDDILKLIIDTVTKGLGFDRAGIFLVSDDGKMAERVIGIDLSGNYEWKGVEFPLSPEKGADRFSNLIHGHTRWYCTNNIQKLVTKEVYQKYYPTITCAAQVPIAVDKNKVIGILCVDNLFTRRRLKKSDLFSLLNFATQAGLSIESYRLHEKITNLTITDSLTSIYNRRYFEQALLSELKRSERYVRPCGLLYVDVDHFKAVNDKWGHAVGDEVLKQVAYILRAGVRNIDIVSRIGGEEFAVILPETPREGTNLVGNRLVQTMADSSLSAEMERVTISVGVACFPESAKDSNQLKLTADKSLYEAKNTGRNKVGPFLGT